MMKYALLLIAVFCLVTASRSEARSGVQQYYSLKDKAELCIVDADYAGALHYYQQAFRCKAPNQRDLYNAFIVAYLNADSAQLKSYYTQLVLHGLTDRKLAILKFGKTYKDQPLYRWVTRDYDSLYALTRQGPMLSYVAVIDSIFDADQAVRVNYRHMSDQDLKLMATRDSANLRFLKSWIRSAGFPGYQRTGLFEKAAEGWIHGNSTIFFVLWHTRDLSTDLDTPALQAVLSGDFPPEDYAVIMDSRAGINRYYSRPPKTEVEGKPVFDVLSEATETAADNERSRIFLCSLKDYKRKLEFQNTTHLFYFFSAMHMALVFASLPE